MRSLPPLCVASLILIATLTSTLSASGACILENTRNETREELAELLDDVNVQLVQYDLRVQGYSREFWRQKGGNRWFQPWKWYRGKGTNAERLLLLYHYYYGLLQRYLTIGTRDLEIHLSEVNTTGCLYQLSPSELEALIRHFLYYDLRNETERLTVKFDDESDVRVCSMRVGDTDGWGRLVYHCCSRNEDGEESCADIQDDEWIWVLRIFIITVTTLLFLYFPKMIPKGYLVYSFKYYPPDGQSFNMILTATPSKYSESPDSTVLPPAHWRKMRQFKADLSKLQPDVVHNVRVKCVTLECGMDRLLSETCSPVSVLRSLFDSLIRCKVRHADPLEDCCNSPLCGELFCKSCPPWHSWLRAARTILVLLVLAVPATPIMYAIAGEDLDYQELANLFAERGLEESYNFYPGPIFGKVIVAVLAFFYLLHMLLVVIDGCSDQNLSRAYSSLLQVTRRKAKLRDRIEQSQGMVRKAAWPFKRFGILVFPIGLVCLVLLPVALVLYLVITSPVPKLILHAFRLMCGKDTDRKHKTKAEMTKCRLVENVLFVFTLVVVFAVLTLGINFLVHLAVISLVQLLVDLGVVMKFLPIFVLLLVYVRDSFKVVNNTYASHHKVVLRHVFTMEAEDLKREADKDWQDQENKAFKIVPATAEDPKGAGGKDEEEYRKKKLFLFKNGAARMRTRSLILFLDKDDIPYISKKFLFNTTDMRCPGCPGPLPEAYLRAAGRFGRTLVFLLFLFLVVLAFADAYFISPTSQFFATMLTGAIPLFLRYLFLNPGSVTTVDTGTLRFQTQMDDKIEEFQQSWEVGDLAVDQFALPEDMDRLYDPHFTGVQNVNEEEEEAPPPTDQEPRPPHKKRGKRHHQHQHASLPALAPPSSDRRAKPRPQSPRPRPHADAAAENRRRVGQLNYMMGGSDVEGMDDADDMAGYRMYNSASMEPQDPSPMQYQQQEYLQPPRSSPRPPKRKKARQTHPRDSEEDDPDTEEVMVGNNNNNNNNNEEFGETEKEKGAEEEKGQQKKKKRSKKAKKEKPKIDLVIDISGEPGFLSGQGPGKEKKRGRGGGGGGGGGGDGSGPPQFHWHKRSRLVTENRGDAEHVI